MRHLVSAVRRPLTQGLLGLTLLATLGLSSAGASATASPTPAAAPECDDSTISTARAMRGTPGGEDFNSVTAAEARSMDADLQRQIDRLIASGKLTKQGDLKSQTTVTIRTYVHIITKKNGKGGVTDQQVAQQMDVINAGYAGSTADEAAPSPFRFEVVGIDRTRNDAWYDWNLTPDFTDEDVEAKEAKRALHQGGYADLNVYIAGLGSGLLGYATFPGGELALDGLVILNESMPGGSAAPYNLGDTATHEIGHWLGLFHTFEGGCSEPGDHVSDTPAQLDGDNIFFCNEADDTCPKAGLDPVHNFMSYGDDFCLDRFTEGQNRRQVATWLGQRAGR
ncbi:MAG TPA: zinc metalloprotease [Nocardioides sp.]|uniref:zinc metalloprotease n=1 Tax=Nocardioides sp. TaxID=35761 RepID=UPI002D7E7066|nr:zinc metalloprotease [Nocardioides sp.]HET6651662.1 zinc metalloprotease [Nocardioides sp.]